MTRQGHERSAEQENAAEREKSADWDKAAGQDNAATGTETAQHDQSTGQGKAGRKGRVADQDNAATLDAAEERELTDRDVAGYLRAHPDFFERRPDALRDLELHHQPGGAAVSLVQRQVAMLRSRNKEQRVQLKELVGIAKDNHELVEKIHQLALSMVTEADAGQRVHLLRTRLQDDFGVERAVLILFAAPCDEATHDGFLKVVDPRDSGLTSFASFRKSDEPLCVRLRPAQKRFAFGDAETDVQSAAVIPLGSHAEHGFIVIGSRDPDYFHPGKRADYLRRLGEVVSAALIPGAGAAAAKSGPKASGS